MSRWFLVGKVYFLLSMFTNEDIENNRVGESEVRCKANLSRITFLQYEKGYVFLNSFIIAACFFTIYLTVF